MRFIMMLKSDDHIETGVLPEPEMLEAMSAYNQELINAGAMLDGNGLQPSSAGFRLEDVDGELVVHDGPFAESKELIAGYWVIQAKSLEEAIEWTKRVPFKTSEGHYSGQGQIEIRRLFEMEDFDSATNESGWKEEEQALRDAVGSHEPIAAMDPSTGALAGKYVYMGFVFADERSESGYVPSEEEVQPMGELMTEAAERGMWLGGEGLRPTSEGARVYFDDGVPRVVDGPFTEAKELVAGYAVMQYDSVDDALAWAKRTALAGKWKLSEFRRVYTAADFGPLMEQLPEVFERELQFREQAGAARQE